MAVTANSLALRQAYIEAGIVTPKSGNDALHVALATVGECPLIVSWNFRHIVHYQKVPLYNAVNALHRYGALDTRSPLKVVEDEDQDIWLCGDETARGRVAAAAPLGPDTGAGDRILASAQRAI